MPELDILFSYYRILVLPSITVGMKPQVTIENPILNSPYFEPSRHFKFDEDGITNEIVEYRRTSTYFIPIPKPRSQGKQMSLEDWQGERQKENKLVDLIRGRVGHWRKSNYFGVNNATRRLLEWWTDPARENKLFFCQIEALETAIYLTEVAEKADPSLTAQIRAGNLEANPELYRIAFKMATGSGKTVVMAMLIAWQAINKILNKQDNRFSEAFLIVAPGITIRDRLRVLLPNDPNNYYKERDLLPPDYVPLIQQAKVVITNFHAFQPKTLIETSKLNKAILQGRSKKPEAGIFTEDEGQMVRRILKEFGGSKKNIVVLNDEAHHCYRRKVTTEDEEGPKLSREEKEELKQREEEARVWISGLETIHRRVGLRAVYDLSATPFFLRGSGYSEGTLFPWVASDFSLIDAIESGIVKIPRVPVEDSSMKATGPTYRELWKNISQKLPKKGRKTEEVSGGLPTELEAALESLYSNYKKYYDRWEAAAHEGSTPPVFIVVCNNTNVSNLVYKYISGYTKELPDGTTVNVEGKFPLFNNVTDGKWASRPNTILVDSQQLESGNAMSADFKNAAAFEIEKFKNEYRARFPDRDVDNISDEDLLREVMNTVGKPGKLGADVRCVVSVSMLTEGWDANTVTHILGVRAFGTQLLCEQVVGRGLRRRSYAANTEGKFEPEYAEVYGVPFSFIPTNGSDGNPAEQRKVTHVRTLPDRSEFKITFPRVQGYRYEFPERRLRAEFSEASKLVISDLDVAAWTDVAGVVGETERHDLAFYKSKRIQEAQYAVSKRTLEGWFKRRIEEKKEAEPHAELATDSANTREFVDAALFPQVNNIVKDWFASCLTCHGETFPQLLLLSTFQEQAANRIYDAIRDGTVGEKRILPRMFDYDPLGSTGHVEFDTTRPTYQARKSHVSHVVCDTDSWEQKMAQVLEETPEVLAYVKNDHLGFAIPYTLDGKDANFYPDFIARIQSKDGSILNLIIEVSGEEFDKKAKLEAARKLWLPAVRNAGVYGEWEIAEVTNPFEFRKIEF
jgi:type III restriction enzyme